uniref:Uncharacterized protein n=1 Tax=Sus scrofa TaxID=9823 RepID=A0A8D1H7Y5_PIG
ESQGCERVGVCTELMGLISNSFSKDFPSWRSGIYVVSGIINSLGYVKTLVLKAACHSTQVHSCSCWPTPQPQPRRIRAASATYTTALAGQTMVCLVPQVGMRQTWLRNNTRERKKTLVVGTVFNSGLGGLIGAVASAWKLFGILQGFYELLEPKDSFFFFFGCSSFLGLTSSLFSQFLSIVLCFSC